MYFLRFYLLTIVDKTFALHTIGVGVFNMQGFERRNKEPKKVCVNNDNNRGILNTSMNRLWDFFEHDDVIYQNKN